ncbi:MULTISPECIES: hypothetical protein [unclassified Streptomyces]|uniref:hypothetical protein n=1 Tax=unclassified Streptomyces TaxID=2593676 RepID=UPI0038167C2A
MAFVCFDGTAPKGSDGLVVEEVNGKRLGYGSTDGAWALGAVADGEATPHAVRHVGNEHSSCRVCHAAQDTGQARPCISGVHISLA